MKTFEIITIVLCSLLAIITIILFILNKRKKKNNDNSLGNNLWKDEKDTYSFACKAKLYTLVENRTYKGGSFSSSVLYNYGFPISLTNVDRALVKTKDFQLNDEGKLYWEDKKIVFKGYKNTYTISKTSIEAIEVLNETNLLIRVKRRVSPYVFDINKKELKPLIDHIKKVG